MHARTHTIIVYSLLPASRAQGDKHTHTHTQKQRFSTYYKFFNEQRDNSYTMSVQDTFIYSRVLDLLCTHAQLSPVLLLINGPEERKLTAWMIAGYVIANAHASFEFGTL